MSYDIVTVQEGSVAAKAVKVNGRQPLDRAL
jgi:hypothetical protein